MHYLYCGLTEVVGYVSVFNKTGAGGKRKTSTLECWRRAQMAERSYVCLGTVAILASLMTGCSGQCNSYSRPQQLFADASKRQLFYSPRYPEDYPSNSDCAWRISAPRNHIVMLSVIQVDLESSQNCKYDNISVYNGSSDSYPLLVTFCSESVKRIYNSGSSMYVRFQSDYEDEDDGFVLGYIAVLRSPNITTTNQPWWEMTSRTTSRRPGANWSSRSTASVVALIGGLVVGVIVFFLLVACCCYCCRGKSPLRTRSPASLAAASSRFSRNSVLSRLTAQQSNCNRPFTVCTDVTEQSSPNVSGVTNGGFVICELEPPSYDSLQFGNSRPTAPPETDQDEAKPVKLPTYEEAVGMSSTSC